MPHSTGPRKALLQLTRATEHTSNFPPQTISSVVATLAHSSARPKMSPVHQHSRNQTARDRNTSHKCVSNHMILQIGTRKKIRERYQYSSHPNPAFPAFPRCLVNRAVHSAKQAESCYTSPKASCRRAARRTLYGDQKGKFFCSCSNAKREDVKKREEKKEKKVASCCKGIPDSVSPSSSSPVE